MRVLLAAAIATLLLSQPANAQELQCGPALKMAEDLKTKFNETQIGGGIVNEKGIFVIYATPNGETWTALAIGVDGNACLIADGKDWEAIAAAPVGEES